MSTEIELKLQLTPKMAKKLASHPLLANIAPQKQRLLNTYYDTPQLDLHARRIAMRFRKKGWQWLLTVKSAEPASGGLAMRSEWETQATPGVFDFSHVDNEELRHFLEQASGQLEPVFTTDFRRQIWHVPFGESLIELAVDRGTIESRGKSTPICEIELELLSGQVADIFGLTRLLQEKLDLHPAIASKAERGYKLFLDEPLLPFRAKPVELNADTTPIEAFRRIALGSLEHFQRNEAGILISIDPEFVHQARVALRRLRSALKLFAPVLPSEFVTAYGQTWQTLASALGEARNLDVFLTEILPPVVDAFPDDSDTRRLGKKVQQRSKEARKSIVKLLAVREYPQLLIEFTSAIHSLGEATQSSLPDFASQQITHLAHRARNCAKYHQSLSQAQRHRMRIAFKKLRYTIEFFSPLLSRKQFSAYTTALERLQDELGQINDYATANEIIRELLSKRPLSPIHGWMLGRHSLLISQLPGSIEIWQGHRTPAVKLTQKAVK